MIISKLTKIYIKLYIRLFGNIKNQMFSNRFLNFCKTKLGIEVGYGSYGYLNFPAGTKIGNYNSIADGVKFLAGNHPMNHVSTAACFYNPSLKLVSKKYDIERKSLEIGNDVWIGQNVLITNKCTNIPNGVCIGAGSIVTTNPPPYTIIAGNPARIIRKRFDDETIELLEKSEWWKLDSKVLLGYLDFMDNPKKFALEILKLKEE